MKHGSSGRQRELAYQPLTDAGPDRPERDSGRHRPQRDGGRHQPPAFAASRQAKGDTAPHQPATYVVPRQRRSGGPPPGGLAAAPGRLPPGVVRYGPGVPGVPVGRAGAESVWRTGQRAGPGVRRGGLGRVRPVAGAVVTVVLLAAAGVVVWLRFFDHPALRVTGVGIIQQAAAGCTVDVTGRISTNGAAGTVSYQWVFRPQTQAPQPLNQSVVAGQHAVYVTVAVQGRGHGTASQAVTLDVLGPGTGTASRDVTISC